MAIEGDVVSDSVPNFSVFVHPLAATGLFDRRATS